MAVRSPAEGEEGAEECRGERTSLRPRRRRAPALAVSSFPRRHGSTATWPGTVSLRLPSPACRMIARNSSISAANCAANAAAARRSRRPRTHISHATGPPSSARQPAVRSSPSIGSKMRRQRSDSSVKAGFAAMREIGFLSVIYSDCIRLSYQTIDGNETSRKIAVKSNQSAMICGRTAGTHSSPPSGAESSGEVGDCTTCTLS